MGLNAVKIGAIFGTFTSVENEVVSLFGAYPSSTSGGSSKIQPNQSQQGSAGKSQSSFSLLGNTTASSYINLGISSFAQGFTEGTEVAGGVTTLYTLLSSAATTSSTAKAIQGILNNAPIIGVASGTTTFATTLATVGAQLTALS